MRRQSVLESCINVQSFVSTSKEDLEAKVAQSQHPVLKALLISKQGLKSSDTQQALETLKKAKDLLNQYQAPNQTERKMAQSVMLSILAQELNIYWLSGRYPEVKNNLQEMKKVMKSESQIRQVLLILFQTKSLAALADYNIKENIQFRYPTATQARFLFLLARVKLATKKKKQAKQLFYQVLELQKSIDIPEKMIEQTKYLIAQLNDSQINNQNYSIKGQLDQALQFDSLIKELLFIETRLAQQQNQGGVSKSSIPFVCTYLRWQHKKDLLLLPIASQKTVKKFSPRQEVCEELRESSLFRQALNFFEPSLIRLGELAPAIEKKVLQSKLFEVLRPASKVSVTKQVLIVKTQKVEQVRRNTVNTLKSNQSKLSHEPKNKQQADEILASCIKGSFIIKINYGNDDRYNKYARITDKGMRWADKKQDINLSYSELKWKNIKGIVYGRVSLNLIKKVHNQLKPWQCFSLIAKDRSYDFYCEDEREIFFWLQGISLQLQKFYHNSPAFPFYSKGRALWKMTLMKMKFCFMTPKDEKAYHNLNTGAVLCFKKEMIGSKKGGKS